MITKERELYNYLYNYSGLTLKELFDKVTKNEISKQDFHWITSFNYDGIKKTRGW